jgi:hypothetical protein
MSGSSQRDNARSTPAVALVVALVIAILLGYAAASLTRPLDAGAEQTEESEPQAPADNDEADDNGEADDSDEPADSDEPSDSDEADDRDEPADSDEADEADDDEPSKDQPPSSSRTEGTRTSGLTRNLMLDSAEIESLDLDAADEEYVVYTFQGNVNSIEDETGFTVQGPTEEGKRNSVSARLMRGETDKVLVGFEDGTDLEQYRIASVETDVVRDQSEEGNPPVTIALGGAKDGTPGMATGPNLTSIKVNDTLDRVEYTFDRELDDDASPSAGDFGYRTLSGRSETGATLVDVDGDHVAVDFDSSVADAKRFYVTEGALSDKLGNPSLPGSIGENTTAPELENVERVGDRTQYDYSFSEDVTNVDPSAFHIYSETGTVYDGDGWTRVDSETIRINYPDSKDIGGKVVMGAVDDGAVEDNGTSGVSNSLNALPISGGDGASRDGLTDGPDLTGTVIDATTGQVTFEFDESINDDTDPDPANFLALTEEGDLVEARSFVEVGEDDTTVMMTFDTNIVRASEGFIVEPGAVEDHEGIPNPGGLH